MMDPTMMSEPLSDYKAPMQVHFSPYEFNGGTILAIAGEDYALIATDTRLSQGFSIHSRDSPKTYPFFDPVGSYEREVFRAKGSASAMLQPLLDNQLGGKNQQGYQKTPMPLKQCIAMVKDVFTSAAERDIYTGDSIVISVVTKDGTKSEQFPLRKD
ncbi:proteasome subunit beta type [Elysia marginata]|uniref:Proteasome subunit beta type n=1 Tax=Elysia marginata TaxID=1093978 RepID=A0AAV4HYQ8_9GAST|nr:proteasome subunit beta type [Elysia marginata]